MEKHRQKDLYWQNVRGIAILAVILIHCKSGVNLGINTFGGGYYLVVRNLINFPVALFFFISGYFVKIPEVKDTSYYMRQRLKKLLIPYLIWSIIYFIFYYIVDSGIKSPIWYLYALFTGGAATPFYYIVVLTIFTLSSSLLLRFANNKYSFIIISLSVIFLQLIGYMEQWRGNEFWYYLKLTPVWIIFYYGGMMLRKNSIHINRRILCLLPIAFVLEILESLLWLINDNMRAISYSQYRLSGFFYSGIICLILYSLSSSYKKVEDNCIINLGNDSYAIFYIHYIFIICFEKMIELFPCVEIMPLVLVHIFEFLFTLFGSVIVIEVMKRAIRNKEICEMFGIY